MIETGDVHIIFVLFGKEEYLQAAKKLLPTLNKESVHIHIVTSTRFEAALNRLMLKNLEILIDEEIEDVQPSQAMIKRYIYSEKVNCKDESIILFRDLDSTWTERDWNAINMFIKSKKKFLIIKDHPAHNINILGGLFGGIRKNLLQVGLSKMGKNFYEKINTKKPINFYGYDQHFLCSKIWPLVKTQSLILDIYQPTENIYSHQFFQQKNYMGNKYLIDVEDIGYVPKFRKSPKAILKDYMINLYYKIAI